MLRTIMTAALLLALPLTATGCGSDKNASSATHSGREETHQTDGTYRADSQGRVNGSGDKQDQSDLGEDLKKAGEDLTRDAKKAAKDAGDAAEGVLNGVTDDPNKNSSLNAGNSSDPPVEEK